VSTPDPPIDAPTKELISRLTSDIATLVRDELRMAQIEAKAKSKKAGIGLGLFGGAGILAVFGIGTLVAAAILGLATAMDAWLAALIVGAALFVLVAATALLGKRQMAGAFPPVPSEAIAGIKADIAVLREGMKR
jgi:hypothetical protein